MHFMRIDGANIPHDDDDIFISHSISITFILTNNVELMERATNENKRDKLLNPFKMCVVIICCLHIHPESSNSTPIYSYANNSNQLVSFS